MCKTDTAISTVVGAEGETNEGTEGEVEGGESVPELGNEGSHGVVGFTPVQRGAGSTPVVSGSVVPQLHDEARDEDGSNSEVEGV